MEHERSADGSPIFDSLDVDLFVKVLAHTLFGPFFVFFVPIFYIFQGAKVTDPLVLSLWYTNGSLFFGPGRLDWGEQIVLITGGSSGVGELLANTLAVRNVNVVVLDINPIVTENYNITYYKCDVSNWEEVEAVSKKVVEEIGDPTVLINNAGVVQGKLIIDLEPQDVKQTFSVNTLAHFWTLKAFLPAMLKNKSGHIISLASVMGYSGAVQMSDYSASKAAAISLHESLRYEIDIRVPDRAWYKFFFPTIQPITVVKRIIAALDDQHSQQISIPFYTNFVPFLPHLPSFMRDFAQWVANANYSMERFTKVSGLRPDEGAFKRD
ncbi:hypothetical protein DXG03_000199 [Asterophora parasitica]|uniref:Uncharacterized protein n=1 Tax=Asterophora parasitica TaxID=117018 RepID=A0A9P7GK98_9AGAR|nr:hypothetical protein DXG03_000199 [Asterophora parasitica]